MTRIEAVVLRLEALISSESVRAVVSLVILAGLLCGALAAILAVLALIWALAPVSLLALPVVAAGLALLSGPDEPDLD